MKQQQLSWTTEKRVVDQLLAHKKSPRTISREQAQRLKESIEKLNLVEIPVIIEPTRRPPSACTPRIQPTRIGATTGIRAGTDI
jgi:hypothetical protein